MAKRAYKIQELVAHPSNVNCLSIAKKTCRLFVTGGDDWKINLWSIGKPKPLMSLCGHTTPVESLAFEPDETRVLGGASTGAVKLWDLEESKLVRSVNGHRENCTAVEFHPFGEFFASGSSDTNIKIWDIRRKNCIHTYKGHTGDISTIKFSPDGRWIVTGGSDNSVKVWDLTAGKILNDFKFHDGPITSIKFHPLEFLLATGSTDGTVKFWDLETFELIGSTKPEETGVRAISFNPDGKTLFCGSDNGLKVFSWEPIFCHDSVQLGWSTIGDLCVNEKKLVGCSYYRNSVGVWVADISLIKPYGSDASIQGFDQEERATDKSVIHSTEIKETTRVLTSTSEKRDDVKNIYIDCAEKSENLLESRETISLSSPGILDSALDKMEPPTKKEAARSKKEMIAFTRTKPGMLLRPASVRKLSNKNKSSDKCSEDLDSGVQGFDDFVSTPLIQLKRCSKDVVLTSHQSTNRSVENSSRLSSMSNAGHSSVEPAPSEQRDTDFELRERSVLTSNSGHRNYGEAAPDPKQNESGMVPDKAESAISSSVHLRSREAAPDPKHRTEAVKVISSVGHIRSAASALTSILIGDQFKIYHERSKAEEVNSSSEHLTSSEPAPNKHKCNASKKFEERSESVKFGSNSGNLTPAEPTLNDPKSVKEISACEHLSPADSAHRKPKCDGSKMIQEGSESVNLNSNRGHLSIKEQARNNPTCNESETLQERSAPDKVINTVAVVTGRTRSLVEKFEKQEKLCSEDQTNIASPSQMPDPLETDLKATPINDGPSETQKEPLFEDENRTKSLAQPSKNLEDENRTNSSSSEAFASGEKMAIEDHIRTASSVSVEESSAEERPNTPQNGELNAGKRSHESQPLGAPSNVIKLAPKSSKNASKPRLLTKSSTRIVLSTKPHPPGNASTSTSLLVPKTTITRDSKPTARMRSFAYGREINLRRNPSFNSTMERPTVCDPDDMSSGGVDISELLQSHDELLRTLKWRLTRLQMIRQFWDRNDLKGAIDALAKLPDQAVQADVVSLLTDKMQIFTLDYFSSVLPVLVGLLDSSVDRHASVSMDLLLKLVAAFWMVIRSTISARPTVGVDIQAQERRECCNICHLHIQKVQDILPSLSRRSGILAKSALELSLLFQQS